MYDYAYYQNLLEKSKSGVKTLAASTVVWRYLLNMIDIMFHDTIILSLYECGKVVFFTGGYYTKITRDRMSAYAPGKLHIESINGRWWLSTGEKMVPYQDFLTVQLDSENTGCGTIAPPFLSKEESEAENARNKVMRQKIKAYVKNITRDSAPVIVPRYMVDTSNDCLACKLDELPDSLYEEKPYFFSARSSVPVNELRKAECHEHLMDHVQSGNYPASMLRSAFKESGIDPNFVLYCPDDMIQRYVRKYLQKRLLEGVIEF